jgi:hypothetical protein
MAIVNVDAPARADWALANPWTWSVTALGCTGLALAWVHVLGEGAAGVRLLLIVIGLLSAGAAVILRFNSTNGAFLDGLEPIAHSRALLALSAAGAVLALSATALLLASLLDYDIPWQWSSVLWMWVLTTPAGVLVAFYFLQRRQAGLPISTEAESAVLLLAAAVTAFLACWALYVNQEQAADWESSRFFLAVLAGVAFLAAPLMLLPKWARQLAISFLIVYHFAGIVSAAMSPEPAPWIVHQVYGRLFRPYLEFMYLTNAYHFYAPEPGANSYVWARIEYVEKVNGKEEHYWRWVKAPRLDKNGRPDYTTAVAYQRRIAMLDNVRGWDTPPPIYVTDKKGRVTYDPIYYYRLLNSPSPPEAVIGKMSRRPTFIVPLHPEVPFLLQYQPLNRFGQQMVSAFAQHLCSLPHPEHPEAKAVSVKIYRVVHNIPSSGLIAGGLDPAHPVTFWPYYQGKYDPKGNLLDAPKFAADGTLVSGDPFLYWLLPIVADVRDQKPFTNDSPVMNWTYLHAGDRKWYRHRGQTEWAEEEVPFQERIHQAAGR